MIKKMNIYGLVLIIVLFWANCLQAQEINDLSNAIEVESKPLADISSYLNTPYRMDFILSGDYIAVTDINNVPSLHIIKVDEVNGYDYVKGIGREGRGPGEYINPNVVISNAGSDHFYVHDAGNMKFVKYNSAFEALTDEEIHIRPNGMPISIHKSGGQFLLSGVIVGAKYSVLDMDGEEVTNVGEDISLGNNVPPNILAQSWHSYSALNEDKNRIAIFSRFADFAEVFDEGSGEKIGEFVNPDFNIPEVQLERGGNMPRLIPSRNAKTAFLWATSTKENIYALYSGTSVREEVSSFGRYVLKFDWDLNLLDAYKLDHKSFSILADPDGNLYSLQLYPAEPLLRFVSLN